MRLAEFAERQQLPRKFFFRRLLFAVVALRSSASIVVIEEIGMALIYRNGGVEIWKVAEAWGFDYYVYGVTLSGDPRVCPSEGMAHELATSVL